MTKCLYVGNLPPECSEEHLRGLFGAEGRALQSVEVVIDHQTGRSRGFAFVVMESDEDAAAALEALRGTEIGGRVLRFGTAHREKRAAAAREGGYEEYRPNHRSRRGRGRS